jgi:Flp pilus assembly protein TadD
MPSCPPPSWSNTTIAATDRATARALFRDGVALFDEGKVAEARAKFEQCFTLAPVAPVALNLAMVEEATGDLAKARDHLAEACGAAVAKGDAVTAHKAYERMQRIDARLAPQP